MTFGERLKAAREAADFTQAQLAKAAGCRQGAISRWENAAQPRPHHLAPLADALGVSVRWLLTGEEVAA